MKKILFILACLCACGSASAIGNYPNYSNISMDYLIPAVKFAANSSVMISTMGASAGVTEVSGNPAFTGANLTATYYTNILVQNTDAAADIYCGYNVNTSTSTTIGIKGAGVQGIRICASSGNISTPPTCSPSQTFPLLPYQQFYCVSSETGSTVSSAVIFKWQ